MIDLILWFAAAAILVAFRLRAFDLPLENDECNYAYIARRLLSGDRLYVDVWDHQPFGIFAMLAGVIALFGDAPNVFRWTACVFSLVSLLLIFDIARRIAGRSAAILAALLFAVVSSDPGTAGEGCQREIYMNTLILAAWWLALRWSRPPAPADLHSAVPSDSSPPLTKGGLGGVFLAGAALGLASTLKTVVAVHWVILAAWLLCIRWRERDVAPMPGTPLPPRERGRGEGLGNTLFARGRRLASTLTAFAAGPLVIWLTASAYFAVTNRWHEFIDAVFLFNVGYSEGGGLLSRFAEFFAPLQHRFLAPTNPPPRFPFTFDSALPLWLLGFACTGILAVVCILRPRRANESGTAPCGTDFPPVRVPECDTGCRPMRSSGAFLILALIAASHVATCLPGRFWPHYYYLMIPPLVLVTMITPIVVWEWWAMPTLQNRAMPTQRTCGEVGHRTPSHDVEQRTTSHEVRQQTTSHKRKRVVDGVQISVGWASPTICGLSMTLIVACTALFQYRHYLAQPLFGLTVNRFNSRDFWGRAQGENVASVTDPGDKIFVFGNDAEIYYYANRRCASRYTMITGLSAKLPGADRRRQILMQELWRDPPRVILVLLDEPPFPEWVSFLHEFYGNPIGFDFHDRTHKPILYVLAHKDRPIRAINWDWDRAAVNGWAIGER